MRSNSSRDCFEEYDRTLLLIGTHAFQKPLLRYLISRDNIRVEDTVAIVEVVIAGLASKGNEDELGAGYQWRSTYSCRHSSFTVSIQKPTSS